MKRILFLPVVLILIYATQAYTKPASITIMHNGGSETITITESAVISVDNKILNHISTLPEAITNPSPGSKSNITTISIDRNSSITAPADTSTSLLIANQKHWPGTDVVFVSLERENHIMPAYNDVNIDIMQRISLSNPGEKVMFGIGCAIIILTRRHKSLKVLKS